MDERYAAMRKKAQYHAARSRQRAARIVELEAALDRADSAVRTDRVPPVYGATRYSVFVPGSLEWQLSSTGEDEQAYRERLWSAERMGPRQQVFLEWATPIYQGFHDAYGYRHVVQYSAEMPARWRDALLDAAATYPVLLPVPSHRWQDRVGAIRDDLRARDAGPGPVAWLRVDDDDLLATTFLDRLVPLVTAAHDGWSVSFGKGLTAEYEDGRLHRFGLTNRTMASMGQTFVGTVDRSGSPTFPPLVSHVRAHREMPVAVDSREVAYLRLLHDQQDRDLAADPVQNPTDAYHLEHLDEDLARLFPTVLAHAERPEESLVTSAPRRQRP